jgi:dTDP-4-dehydrorhamnose reductase
MKVMVIGAAGQLGSDLCRVLNAQGILVIPLVHSQLDVTDAERVEKAIASARPDVVINTAAFHKVDLCESEPARSFAVNAIGPWNLARACQRSDAVLVHFSTDYVFGGEQRRPYSEDDLPGPISVYGVSKLAGECMIPFNCRRYFTIRTCGLYGIVGSAGKGGNFVETMLKKAAEGVPIRVVNDQRLTPTFTGDLAEVVAKLIHTKAHGLYHVTNEGECSWFEFAQKIFDLAGVTADLKPITTPEFYTPVQRPAYSVLSKAKLAGLGLCIPHWQDGLKRYLAARISKR